MFRHSYIVYTLFNGDIYHNNHNKCSLDSAAKIIKKTVKRRGSEGRTWTLSRKRLISRFGKGLVWQVWIVPWLVLVLGGVEGVTSGAPIPGCSYSYYGDRTCGIRKTVDTYLSCTGTSNAGTGTCGGNYGPITEWNTSLVTDMSHLFYLKNSFNANIAAWNVSRVTKMHSSKFTPPLSPLLFFLHLFFSSIVFFFFFFFHLFGWVNHTCILLQCFLGPLCSIQTLPRGILLRLRIWQTVRSIPPLCFMLIFFSH